MTNATAGAQADAPKTVAQMLGEIVWLLTQSPVHKQMFIGDLEWFCMPAVLLEQYRVFYGPNAPAAVALWARVADETDARLREGGGKLRPDEWNSGENAWLIELVTPFGGVEEILNDLAVTVFGGQSFKYHTLDASGQRTVTVREGATSAERV